MYIKDNYDYFEEMDYEREMKLSKMPKCECCGNHIQTEEAFYYNYQWFCKDKECEEELMQLVWEDIRSDYLFDVEE